MCIDAVFRGAWEGLGDYLWGRWPGWVPEVSQAIVQVIPAAIGEVQPPQEGHYLVHNQELLMMGPQGHLVWVAHDLPQVGERGQEGGLW